MLLPFQSPPIIRVISTTKTFNQKIGSTPSQVGTLSRNTYLQCQICCELGGGDNCRAIPDCTCSLPDLVAEQ